MSETNNDPRVIGPYRVIAGLGMGGMARVYLALSQKPGFDKLLVLKLLRDELLADTEFRTMFLNEARVAARLNHPNVVNTYEIGVHDEQHFIAMEYLEGQALSAITSRVGRKNMPLAIHLRIISDVCAGLDYAHNLTAYDGTPLALVHRDVSPQNVFVTYPGLVKLVDFGIAKMAGSAVLTQDGTMKGKLGFMAPEQALSQPVDARADIFSVGVMIWEALAHTRFYPVGDSEAAVLRRRITGEERKVKELNPDAPDELVAICEKAMALSRDDRYASAADLRAALEGYLKRTSNPDAHEVARFLDQHFAEDRVKMGRLVETQLKNGPTSASAPLLMLTTLTSKEASPARPSGGPRDSDGAQLVETAQAPPAPRRRKIARIAMAASLLGIGAIVSAALFGWPKKTTPPTTTAAPVAADPKLPPISPPAPDKPAPAPQDTALTAVKGSPVVITFDVSPSSARVVLDGKAIDPPFVVKRAADGSTHRVEVSARGYATVARNVTFDKDHTESVALGRAAYGAVRPVSGKPAGGTATTDPTDVDLAKEPRGGKPKRQIDDQDPY